MSASSTALPLQAAAKYAFIKAHPMCCLPERVCAHNTRGEEQQEVILQTELKQLSRPRDWSLQHTFAWWGEIEVDSSTVWKILGIIIKLKFNYVANITALQFHLK